MKSAIILFLSLQLFDPSGGAWMAKQLSQDLPEYVVTESDRTRPKQNVQTGFTVSRHSVFEDTSPYGNVPVISKGPSAPRKYSKLPTQDTGHLEKPLAVLPNGLSILSGTKTPTERNEQKRTGRKKQNNLRKKARDLMARYSRLNLLGFLTDNLTGGQGMAIPA